MRLFTLLFIILQVSCANTSKLIGKAGSPKKFKATVTAYAAIEDSKYRNKSAIGHTLKAGESIATDWSRIPVNSVLRFNGRDYTVHDYGTALVRKVECPIVDLYVLNRKQIRSWGKREMEVEVVRWGSFAESKRILAKRLAYRHCREMYNNIH